MKSVFTVAYRGTFGEFMGLYRNARTTPVSTHS